MPKQLEFIAGTGIGLTANAEDKSITIASTSAEFTADEKAKLAALESSHFKGEYATLSALEAIEGAAGDYAYVDLGEDTDVTTYIWDTTDEVWVEQKGITAAETAASIKTKYESNANTNAFTDTEQTKLSGIAAGAEVNQNAFSSVTAGGTTVSSGSKTDTLALAAGTGVTLTGNAGLKTVTVAADLDTILAEAFTTVKVGAVILGA
jgi:hypothetical protein